jgi:hypothetical protein
MWIFAEKLPRRGKSWYKSLEMGHAWWAWRTPRKRMWLEQTEMGRY